MPSDPTDLFFDAASIDYPHTGCGGPNSRSVIERVFRSIQQDQVETMLCDEARALYRIEL